MRAIVTGLAIATLLAVAGCASGAGHGLDAPGSSSAGAGSDAGRTTPSGVSSSAIVRGVPGREYKHGLALISLESIKGSDKAPPSGKAWFDITGLQLSTDRTSLTFGFVVACDGDPVGSLVTSPHEFASHDGRTIAVNALSGGGATDIYGEVPADCRDATVTVSAPGLGPIRYDVPAVAHTTSH
jgi:hypothetical protein